jgi:hypothetical protein
MLSKLIIEQIIDSQKKRLGQIDTGLIRKISDFSALAMNNPDHTEPPIPE